MAKTPLNLAPGIVKDDTPTSQEGRWIDGDKVRFERGRPQKIGGWQKFLDSPLVGICRSMKAWRTFDDYRRLAFATSKKLYEHHYGVTTDITPLDVLKSGTLTDPFATTAGSSTVTVTHTAHGQKTGDWVLLDAPAAVGGLVIKGPYKITVTNVNEYTFTHEGKATSSDTGGGSVSYEYFRAALGSDPFETTAGSAVVTVTHVNHGRSVGDYVHFDGATAVGGITIDGEYTVTEKINSDTYTITHSSAATSSATGGGSGVNVQYEIPIGYDDQILGYGWGVGPYGMGTYGTPRDSKGVPTLAPRTWTLDNYGEVLVACPRSGRIYEWDRNRGGRALPMLGAPRSAAAILVTEERFILALGADGDLMKIAWPDQDDRYNWTASDLTTAGDYTVNYGSYLVSGRPLKGNQVILFTDKTVIIGQWTGDEFVYGFRSIGVNAGLVGPMAVVAVAATAYWMSENDFFVYDGAIRPIGNADIRNYVFNDINREQQNKFFAAFVAQFSEVWFFYCSANSTEIDRYVIYDIAEGVWSIGTMARTAWIDADLFEYPMAAGADSYIYEHEKGKDADGAAMDSWILSAPMDIRDGDQHMDLVEFWPDFKDLEGSVEVVFITRDYPQVTTQHPETTHDALTVTTDSDKFDPRGVSGRYLAIKVRSNELGGHWRWGKPMVDVIPSGAR